jgi:hypothetical protein
MTPCDGASAEGRTTRRRYLLFESTMVLGRGRASVAAGEAETQAAAHPGRHRAAADAAGRPPIQRVQYLS